MTHKKWGWMRSVSVCIATAEILVFIFLPVLPVFAQEALPIDTASPVVEPVDTESGPVADPVISEPSPEQQTTVSDPVLPEVESPTEENPTSETTTDSVFENPSDSQNLELEGETDNIEPMALESEEVEGDLDVTNPVSRHVRLSKVDQSNGALSFEYAIVTPPGRNDFDLGLALTYSSQDVDDSDIAGYGWEMNIPYIERINRTGSNNLYQEENFVSSVSGELVRTASTTSFRAKSSDSDLLQYEYIDDFWTVTDKSGTVYVFGQDNESRLSASTTHVFRWMLSEVRDANGNYATYDYTKNQNQIYPDLIAYSNHASSTGIFSVGFEYEDRPSYATSTSWKTGFEVVTSKRLERITVEVENDIVREYGFQYESGANGVRQLLAQIEESGIDENGVRVSLSPVEFQYQETESETWSLNPSWGYDFSYPHGVRYGDVNGDGLTDIVYNVVGNEAADTILINTGTGWSGNWNSVPGAFFEGNNSSREKDQMRYSHLVDLNGDGLADVLDLEQGEAYINTGNISWTATSSWAYAAEVPESVRLADVNGDGLIDMVMSWKVQFQSPHYRSILLNTGSGWVGAPVDGLPSFEFFWQSDSSSRSDKITEVSLADVNGDGLADIYNIAEGDVYLNNGNLGWQIAPHWHYESDEARSVRMADANNDGLVDVVRNYKYDSWYDKEILINRNTYWGHDSEWSVGLPTAIFYWFPNTSTKRPQDYEVGLIDFNGDGVMDVYDAQKGDMYIGNAKLPDLLVGIDNGRGGLTEIGYSNSATLRNGGELENPTLPLNVTVVRSITNSDSFGTNELKEYAYEDGHYYYRDAHDRKFAGFGRVTETRGDKEVVSTYYHQGNQSETDEGEFEDHVSKIGKPYRIEQYGTGSAALYKLIRNKWETMPLDDKSYLVTLTKVMDSTYDGDSDRKTSATSYEYDQVGNVRKKVTGQVVSGDNSIPYEYANAEDTEYVTTFEYASSTNSYMYKPSTIVTSAGLSRISEVRHYYDELPLGQIEDGNMTQKEEWVEEDEYVTTKREYDDFGLVISETDGRDNVTGYDYDDFNLYVATSTNALDHETIYEYDYSSGKPKKMVNVNRHTYETAYDGFDRIVEKRIPDFGSSGTVTSVTYGYEDIEAPVSIHETRYLTASTTAAQTYTYYDGFGRVIDVRRQAESGDGYAVVRTKYDATGRIQRKSLPVTSPEPHFDLLSTPTHLYVRYEYDPVGRLKTAEDANGETMYEYDDWVTTVQDPNGNYKEIHKDGYDRLVKVVEKNDGSNYATEYEYDALSNLTAVTDASDNVRSFTYDGLGRRRTATDMHAESDSTYGTWEYDYDENNNLIEIIDPKNQVIKYQYDVINRPEYEDYLGKSGLEVRYGYDTCTNGIGLLCSATTTDAAIDYGYDEHGSVASESVTIDGTKYVTSYQHDRQGNIEILMYPDGSQVKHVYNSFGKLEKIEYRASTGNQFADLMSDIDYGPHGNIIFEQAANGIETTNVYDDEKTYRLVSKKIENSDVLKMFEYQYDPVGNITQITESGTAGTPKVLEYGYDDLNRLTSATSTAEETAMLAMFAGTSTQWYRLALTIGHENIPADLIDFPVYVDLADLGPDFWYAVSPDGSDIRIRTADGTTPVSFEIVDFSQPSASGELHFKAPNLSSTVDNVFYVEFGSSTLSALPENDPYGRNAVWSDYAFVSHDGMTDSSGNYYGNNPVYSIDTSSDTVDVKVGKSSVYLGGSSEQRIVPGASTTGRTSTLWARDTRSGYPKDDHLFDSRSGGGYIYYSTGTDLVNYSGFSSVYLNGAQAASGTTTLPINTWGHFVLRTAAQWTDPNLRFGMHWNIESSSRAWEGQLDELRVTKTRDLGPEWIAAEYANQSDPTAFYATSTPEVVGAPQPLPIPPPAPEMNASYVVTYEYDPIGNLLYKSDVGTYAYNEAEAEDPWANDEYPPENTYQRCHDGIDNDDNGATDLSDYACATFVTPSAGASPYANPHAATTIGTTTVAYDQNGNMLYDGRWAYGWDYRNRLTSADSGLDSVTYGYDHEGNRVAVRSVGTSAYPNRYYEVVDGTSTRNVYAGDRLVATIEGSTASTTVSYVHGDHLGSTSVVTDSAGQIAEHIDYDPFGSIREDGGTGDVAKKYVGREYDEETDLSYLNARYYQGSRGQFLSQDPSFLDIGANTFERDYQRTLQQHLMNPQALNSYSYAHNNPITYSDPDGEILPLVPIALGALAFYGGYSAGTDLYEGYNNGDSGQFAWGVVGAAGSLIPGGGAAKGAASMADDTAKGIINVANGLKVGQSFGKLGSVAENVAGKINSFDSHALMRMEQRGVGKGLMEKVVSNPLVTLKQAGDRTLYLTKEAAVVLDKTGKAITTYTKNEFKPHVLKVLNSIKNKKN